MPPARQPGSQQERQGWLPPIPSETVAEGGRWRHHKPNAEMVREWFAKQPLDEGMRHDDFVSGVVLIPAGEKVKYRNPNTGQQTERYEDTWTAYVSISTRVRYFRMLAKLEDAIVRIVPDDDVPVIDNVQSVYHNANLPPGLFWYAVRGDGDRTVRFLCARWKVQLHQRDLYLAGNFSRPIVEGTGTKQTSGGADISALMKAETGAVGRALGLAGILVVGTGIASAEDMQEALAGQQGGQAAIEAPRLPSAPEAEAQVAAEAAIEPAPVSPEEADAQLRTMALALQGEMKAFPDAWKTYAAWYSQRGFPALDELKAEALRGAVGKLQRDLDAAKTAAATSAATLPEA